MIVGSKDSGSPELMQKSLNDNVGVYIGVGVGADVLVGGKGVFSLVGCLLGKGELAAVTSWFVGTATISSPNSSPLDNFPVD